MGTASLRLHDGTVVTANFEDNNDGRIQDDERSRAQSALRAELVRLGRSGSEIDANASIYILENGTDASNPAFREGSITAGDLARTGTVRLFGANPSRVTEGYSDPALWAPSEHEIMADGTRAVIYHEANRWDEARGTMVWGRTLRVEQNGTQSVLTGGGSPSTDDPYVWVPIGDYTPPAGNRIPSSSLPYIPPSRLLPAGLVPPSDGAWHKVSVPAGSVTPRAWTLAGAQDGYLYFQAGDALSRRSVANPNRDEVMVTRGTGANGLTGAVWRVADDADAVPNAATVGTGTGAQPYTLTPANPAVSSDGAFDLFTGRRSGSAEPMTFRRPHGNSAAPFQALQGTAWVDPATISTAPVVSVGTGASARSYTLTPATPASAAGYDMFTGSISGSSATLTFRRRQGVADAPYEVRQGTRWVAPAAYGTAAAPAVGGVHTGGGRPAPRRSTSF